jgi:hypothetical protein
MNAPTSLDDHLQNSRDRLGLGERRFDVGLLLVHGIGEQQRGDTLTEAGDRLIDWLQRNVKAEEERSLPSGATRREMTLVDVVLRQVSGDDVPAAHAIVRMGQPDDEVGATYWVIAEAWWADVFRQATFTQVALWGVTVGHWVFATQIAAIRQRMQIADEVPTPLRLALLPIVWLVGMATVLLAGVLSLLLTVVALVLVPLALSKIPIISGLAAAAQRTLGGGVGDAYVLTQSPLRFGAMASQVRSDLQTLRKTSYSVAVVAHSQGTAVAWAALKREILQPQDPTSWPEDVVAPIGLFVTYGQALRKLTFMLLVGRGDIDRTRGSLTAASNSVLLVVAAALFVMGLPLWTVVVTLYLAIVVEFRLLIISGHIDDRTTAELQRHWLRIQAVEPALRWVDLWASADPVPVGPLRVTSPEVPSYKIQNLASIVLDHVVYWQNKTEFLEPIAAQLHLLGGEKGGCAQSLTSPRLQVAAMRRHARVHLLLAMHAILAVGIIAFAAAAFFSQDFATGVIAIARGIPFATALLNMPAVWVQRLAGVIVVLAAGAIVWAIVGAAWSALIGRDDEAYVVESDLGLWRPVAWPILGAVIALLGLVTTATLLALNHPFLAFMHVIVTPIWALLSVVVFSSGGRAIYTPDPPASSAPAALKIGSSTLLGTLDVLVVISALIAIPVVIFYLTDGLAPMEWALVGEGLFIGVVLLSAGLREYGQFRTRYREMCLPEAPL